MMFASNAHDGIPHGHAVVDNGNAFILPVVNDVARIQQLRVAQPAEGTHKTASFAENALLLLNDCIFCNFSSLLGSFGV